MLVQLECWNRSKSISAGVYRHEYTIEDHLGNTRIVYSDLNNDGLVATSEVLDENHYYAYGMELPGSFTNVAGTNYNYKYNGIERVEAFNMDFAFYRGLDPVLGRWYQVDPKAEQAGFGMSPYCSMNNNPISQVDPLGDSPILIGAAIGLISNGIGNVMSGQNFFKGGFKAALFGAIGGGISAGIGNAAQGLGKAGDEIGKAIFQAGAHAVSGGILSVAQGGTFGSGAAAGAFSSGVGSGIAGLDGGGFAQWLGGGLSGGVGSSIAGGSFWSGLGQGLITGGLNHAAHELLQNKILNGGPPWEYNGKQYNSKVDLYQAILVDQAAEQFGIKDILALGAAIDNAGYLSKPFVMEGASTGTSIASKYGAKLLPQQMPIRMFTHFNKAGNAVFTKTLGRFIGRTLGPVGWAILTYDVGKTFYNTHQIYNKIVP